MGQTGPNGSVQMRSIRARLGHMGPDGAKQGQTWPNEVKPGKPENNLAKSCKIGPDGIKSGSNKTKQDERGPKETKWGQSGPKGTKLGQTGPNEMKQVQMGSNGAKLGQNMWRNRIKGIKM